MEIKATTRYVRMSPTKARNLTRAITGLSVGEALRVVELNQRKAAVHLGKTLKSAIANAENNADLSADKLWVTKAVVSKLAAWSAMAALTSIPSGSSSTGAGPAKCGPAK